MANEIQYDDPALTGQTLYYVLTAGAGDTDAGKSWNGTAWAAYTTTRATWDIAMTETPSGTGRFVGSLPTAAAAIDKTIKWIIYQDANDDGTPDHATDILLAEGEDYWDGTNLGTIAVGDVSTLVNLVSSLLPPGNVSDRTWVMRRTAVLVGSNTTRYKSDDETITMWADVSRLLGENEEIGDLADIDVTASGVTITAIGKQGDMIYATFAGGTVDEDAVSVTWEFETDSGSPIVATSPLVIID